ncbi:hypothetical protein [Bradyrhizobium lablabi]|uniref:hypothetical protein n=1 Tax=Bradyrhizobium lablabi TaxID=722472 RepID=UPI001BA56A51|nr:hypothetical protein [Bradyrhizobium lablabi]MBR0696570.1 hypothetical protein [Bradyrhizobium lablabi]
MIKDFFRYPCGRMQGWTSTSKIYHADLKASYLKLELKQFAVDRGRSEAFFFDADPPLCRRTSVSGRTMVRTDKLMETSDTAGSPAIMVRQPEATLQPPPQDDQLMSKRRSHVELPLERRGQGGQNKEARSSRELR